MNTRPSLGFDDDDAPVETKPSVLSLDDFKPTPVKRPSEDRSPPPDGSDRSTEPEGEA